MRKKKANGAYRYQIHTSPNLRSQENEGIPSEGYRKKDIAEESQKTYEEDEPQGSVSKANLVREKKITRSNQVWFEEGDGDGDLKYARL